MPFKSEAQKRKIIELERKGKVKPGTAAKWAKETPRDKKLPERKHPRRAGNARQSQAPSSIRGRFGLK